MKWNTLCINQPKYRDVIKAELKEIQERYHPDGYWIDIANSYECVCPVCRDEMLEMGLDPRKREDVQKHDRMAEIAYCRDIYTFLKEMDPNLDIYFNSFPYALDNRVNKETSSATKRKYYSFVDIESLPSEEWGYNHFPISASYVNKYDQEIATPQIPALMEEGVCRILIYLRVELLAVSGHKMIEVLRSVE